MNFISESESTRLISHETAFEAVRKALVAAASGGDRTRVGSAEHLLKSGSTPGSAEPLRSAKLNH
jgi:hypothetical protein